jgi:hypothetical protein
MPRDSNGNYTLPSGNPVVTGEVISTGWANPTMSDIGAEITNSLDRQGRGGMLAPFKFADGTNGAPGMTWTNEPTTGFYRAGASDMRATVAGVSRMRWTSAGVDVYDVVAGTWVALSDANGVNFPALNAENKFTQQQIIVNASSAWAIWKDATPTLAGRLGFNIGASDQVTVDFFSSGAWKPKFAANATLTQMLNNQFDLYDTDGNNLIARLVPGAASIGYGAYSPVTSGASFLGVTGKAGTPVVVGCYHPDGYAYPRAELFAYGDGAASGVVGIDWVFSSGVSSFQFRRAGTPIFDYTDSSVRVLDGRGSFVYGPGNGSFASLLHDGSTAYWNTDVATSSFQWYLNSVLVATLNTSGFLMSEARSVQLKGPADNGLTSMREQGGASGFLIYQESGQPINFNIGGTTRFVIDGSKNTFYNPVWLSNNASLSLFGPGDANYVQLNFLADAGGGAQLRIAGRGATQHWDSTGLTAGGVVITTTTPGATGTPGVTYLVYE